MWRGAEVCESTPQLIGNGVGGYTVANVVAATGQHP